MSGSTSINNPEPKVENFPAEGEGIVNETGLEQSLSELAVGQAQESPASETDNTTAPGRGGSEDPPETSQVDEANENNNPRERPTVTISETESNVIWVQGTPFYITNEPPFRLNRPESADLNSARPASGMSSSSQPDNNHEDQEIDVTNNTPDRFELFLLGPGEKKVTEEIDTRKSFTLSSSSSIPYSQYLTRHAEYINLHFQQRRPYARQSPSCPLAKTPTRRLLRLQNGTSPCILL